MPRYRNKRGRPKTRNKKPKRPSLHRNTGRKQGWNLKKGNKGISQKMIKFGQYNSDGDYGRFKARIKKQKQYMINRNIALNNIGKKGFPKNYTAWAKKWNGSYKYWGAKKKNN